MDQLAEELGLDRLEIRRRNLIGEHEFPYAREGLLFADGLKVTLDSGQYAKALDMAAKAVGAAAFKAEQEAARAAGRYLGLGLACYVEGTGLGPYEGGHVRIHPITGKVYVNTGLAVAGPGPRHRVRPDRRRPARRPRRGRDRRRGRHQGVRLGRRHLCEPGRRGQRQCHSQHGGDRAPEDAQGGGQHARGRHRRGRAARFRGLGQRLQPLRAARRGRDGEQSVALCVQRGRAGRDAVRPGEPARRAAAGGRRGAGPGGHRLLQPAGVDLGLRGPCRDRRGRSGALHGEDPASTSASTTAAT